jgi:hypothetical protein
MRGEALPQFIAGGPEGRTVPVGDQVVYREILAAGLEPAQQRPHILITLRGLDSAEQCVLEDPVKEERRGVL